MAKIKVDFECAESTLLLKTYNGIRQKTMKAEAEAEAVFEDLDIGEQRQ